MKFIYIYTYITLKTFRWWEKITKNPGENIYGKLIVISKSPRINVQNSRIGPHKIPVIEKQYNFVSLIELKQMANSG